MEEMLIKIAKKRELLTENNKKIKETIEQLDNHDLLFDELTAFLNKNFFSQNNIRLLALSLIEGMVLNKINNDNCRTDTVVFCDINGLKIVNDTLGHAVGDVGIKAIAGIIKRSLRMKRKEALVDTIFFDKDLDENIAIRIGGDEFLIILPNCTKEKALETVIKRIKENIEKNLDSTQSLSLSIGSSDTTEMDIPDSISDQSLNDFFVSIVSIAEERMYQDKKLTNQNNSSEAAKKAVGRLADILGLDIRNNKDYKKLLEIIDQARNDMK